MDNWGLLGEGALTSSINGSGRPPYSFSQKPFVRHDLPNGMSLLDVVHKVKPTILLGLSGKLDIFLVFVTLVLVTYIFIEKSHLFRCWRHFYRGSSESYAQILSTSNYFCNVQSDTKFGMYSRASLRVDGR